MAQSGVWSWQPAEIGAEMQEGRLGSARSVPGHPRLAVPPPPPSPIIMSTSLKLQHKFSGYTTRETVLEAGGGGKPWGSRGPQCPRWEQPAVSVLSLTLGRADTCPYIRVSFGLGTGETVRVVSMDKDFHVDCYVCESCGMQLTDEPDQRCYPLDGHLLCRNCHLHRLHAMGRTTSNIQ
ncbi:Wilms tumor protein 1-interacting protein-like protein, partial [Penaeus vannamei]